MMFAEAAINAAANDAKSTIKVTLLFPEVINPAIITVKNVMATLPGRIIFKALINSSQVLLKFIYNSKMDFSFAKRITFCKRKINI